MSAPDSKRAFYQQSTWMMVASVLSGGCMVAVQMLAGRRLPSAEFGLFGTLVGFLTVISIPTLGLQAIFAQQTAMAISEGHERAVRSAARAFLNGTTLLWLALVLGAALAYRPLAATFKISNPAALWFTLLVTLLSFWAPVVSGILQGRENFAWLGWIALVAGVGRLAAVGVVVLFFHGWAAGVMIGVFIGMAASSGLAFWQCRGLLSGPGEPVPWRAWLRPLFSLTLGLGASQFIFSADRLFLRANFPEEVTGGYMAAALIGTAMVMFTAPVAMVMFPKVARSSATLAPTDALRQALLFTAGLSALAALACTFFPRLPLWVLYKEKYLAMAPLVPWFAWCMAPMTLTNVLIGNLMARRHYRGVMALAAVAALYGVALWQITPRLVDLPRLEAFTRIVQTMGVFGVILFGVAARLSFHRQPSAR